MTSGGLPWEARLVSSDPLSVLWSVTIRASIFNSRALATILRGDKSESKECRVWRWKRQRTMAYAFLWENALAMRLPSSDKFGRKSPNQTFDFTLGFKESIATAKKDCG